MNTLSNVQLFLIGDAFQTQLCDGRWDDSTRGKYLTEAANQAWAMIETEVEARGYTWEQFEGQHMDIYHEPPHGCYHAH